MNEFGRWRDLHYWSRTVNDFISATSPSAPISRNTRGATGSLKRRTSFGGGRATTGSIRRFGGHERGVRVR